MDPNRLLTSKEISEIVNGFDPIDWVQIDLLAKILFEKRLLPGLNAQEFSMAALPGTFRRKFPDTTNVPGAIWRYRLSREHVSPS